MFDRSPKKSAGGSPAPNSESPLLTAAQVAALLCTSERSVRRADHIGKLPRGVRVTARSLRWRRDELLHWIAAGCPSRSQWEAMRDG